MQMPAAVIGRVRLMRYRQRNENERPAIRAAGKVKSLLLMRDIRFEKPRRRRRPRIK